MNELDQVVDALAYDGGEPEPPADEPGLTFATFFVGEAEIALPTSCVREVVWFPESVSPVPLTAPYVEGIFSLRGEVVPILDFDQLLGIEREDERTDAKVVIVECDCGAVGFTLDRTGEVVRPAPDEVRQLGDDGGASGGVLAGVIHDRESGRIVQVLSLDKLGALHGVPLCANGGGGDAQRADPVEYDKSIVVKLNDLEIGLRVDDVIEVQEGLKIEPAPRYFPHCAGIVQLRGEVYPVLDCKRAFGLESEAESSRFLFIEQGGVVVAALVDSLVETLEYPEEWVLDVPRVLTTTMSTVCQRVISVTPTRHVLLMDVKELFGRFQVCSVPGGARSDARRDEAAEHGEELSFLAFRIGETTLSVPLGSVVEIQEVGDGAFSAGEGDGLAAGLMNLRGRIVPLLDGHALVGDGPSRSEGAPLSLILRHGDEVFGLIVSAIVDIKRIAASSIAPADGCFRGKQEGLVRYLDRAFLADCNDKTEVFVVLDVASLTQARSVEEQAAGEGSAGPGSTGVGDAAAAWRERAQGPDAGAEPSRAPIAGPRDVFGGGGATDPSAPAS